MDDVTIPAIPDQFRKHSALIAVDCDITAMQRKAFNGLVAIAAQQIQQDPIRDIYDTTLSEIAALTGIVITNRNRVIEKLLELRKKEVKLNVFGKDANDPNNEYFASYTLLSGFTVYKQQVTFEFTPTIRNRIAKPRIYAPLNFEIIRNLEGKYSAILYEMLTDYKRIHRLEKSLELCRRVLGIKPEEYKSHYLFDSKVIKPAVNELNEKSNLNIAYRYVAIGMGSKLTHIVFTIKEDDRKSAFNSDSIMVQELNLLTDQLPDFLKKNKKLLVSIKTKYNTDGFDYVQSNIEFAIKKAKTNPARMIQMALDDDFAAEERAKKQLRKTKKAAPAGSTKGRKAESSPQARYLSHYAKLSSEEQEAINKDIERISRTGGTQGMLLMGPLETKIFMYLSEIKGIKL